MTSCACGNPPQTNTAQVDQNNVPVSACFEIASNDARSLRLFVDPPYDTQSKRVWFALH